MSSSGQLRYACTALQGVNKAGILKPDAKGYYHTVVGGLNVFNSAGQFYVYEQARELFEKSSQFQRRVARGVLGAELGHPKRLPGQTDQQYLSRIMSIEETNVCGHHREIWLDFDNVRDQDGKPVIAIMSAVAPAGPHGESLRKSFENPDENVCFSIRSFTDDYYERGIEKRILRTIITFDKVTEPGIEFAQKYRAPALESYSEHIVTRKSILQAIDSNHVGGLATEGAVLCAHELLDTMGWARDPKALAHFTNW